MIVESRYGKKADSTKKFPFVAPGVAQTKMNLVGVKVRTSLLSSVAESRAGGINKVLSALRHADDNPSADRMLD